jgi:hypothetical protein
MRNVKEISKRLYYFSTFDGYLDNRGDNRNSRLSVTMKADNSDYIYYVAQALKDAEIGYKIWEPALNINDGCNRKQQLRIQSKAHPKLTSIRHRIYIENKKVIDPHMLTMMDAEALAIIFMADGSRKNIQLVRDITALYRIHTNGFSYGDNYLLAGAIKEKLNIPFDVEKQAGNKWGLTLSRRFNNLFEDTIFLYILDSFSYKLGRQTPEKDDDIVCSAQKCAEVSRNEVPRINPKMIRINK